MKTEKDDKDSSNTIERKLTPEEKKRIAELEKKISRLDDLLQKFNKRNLN